VPRKNVEAMALRLFGAGPEAAKTVRALQQFVGEGGWDDAAILAAHRRLVDETLGEADGVLIIDGSDFPKQGTHSAGVARQWCGHTGKKDNCQAGVFLGYASRTGYTLLDRRLYLPACWFTPEYRERWEACRIPPDTPFRTKPELAAELVEAAMAHGDLRARWVVCDEGYGNDPAMLDRFAAIGLWYLAEVPRDTQIWPLVEPDGQTARSRPERWVPPQKPSRKGPVPQRAASIPQVRPKNPPTSTPRGSLPSAGGATGCSKGARGRWWLTLLPNARSRCATSCLARRSGCCSAARSRGRRRNRN
jgi:SRSO17 transposase